MKCLQMVDIDTVFDIMGLEEVLESAGEKAKSFHENNTELIYVDNMGLLITSLLSSGKSGGKCVSMQTL
jgi:hypothetical protein